MFRMKKMISVISILMVCIVFSSIGPVYGGTIGKSNYTAHNIAPGKAFSDNPLKGFVPFSSSYTDFPHSLEWFYIPMSALYPKPNSTPDTKPDWSALEKELNIVAKRGNQAVFRIYIDYPSQDPDDKPVGIPGFLRKEPYNLDSHDYGDYGNYISRIPDYSDKNLRKTIQNCIADFGAKYDGDKRIGFITGGFLGFWGEWHCYPYNGVNNVNYEPTLEEFNEVTTAYEKAFKKTKILFRYPVGDIIKKPQFGYHDDSYCFETIPVANGGESFNFGEKLKISKPSNQNRWQVAPIGGELRPEIQMTIFKQKPWTGAPAKPKENWDANLKLIHPSWMLNESIKKYDKTLRETAITASNQLGYDFRVETAYYSNNVDKNQNIYLGIDIKNIGVAPFYYDHTTWPVKVGIKQSNKLITSWITNWDLNKIAADSKTIKFQTTAPVKNGLKDGYYSLCIKVENPLSNGNKLGFANENQFDDGWLDLGTFTVGNGGTMPKPTPIPKQVHQQKIMPKEEAAASNDPNSYEAEAEVNTITGTAIIDANAKYSGGKKVGYIGNSTDSTLQFNNVKVDKDGDYTVTIFYTTALARSAIISINGENGVNYDFVPGINWTKVLTFDINVKLKAGDNTIKFSNESGWTPDIDRIKIK